MLKLLKKVFAPVFLFLLKPKTRYKYISFVQQLSLYNKTEEILNYSFGYIDFTHVHGDYLEFGVWKGRGLKAAFHLSKRYPNLESIKFYGFDSFEGLPKKEGVDIGTSEFKEGDYTHSLENVKKDLENDGVDLSRVTLVKGWFKDALTEKTRKRLPIKSAAVIYVDSDLYESAVPVLKFIIPYIVDGSVIVFDDWYCFKGRSDKGEQRAFKEWLAQNPQFTATPYRQFGWSGNSFIINT